VWSELLRQKGATARDDPWIVKAQGALWQRLGDRFTYRAEADYPLVGAREVDKKRPADTQPEKRSAGRRDRDERPQSQNQEDRPR
jgi:hypothetical protein